MWIGLAETWQMETYIVIAGLVVPVGKLAVEQPAAGAQLVAQSAVVEPLAVDRLAALLAAVGPLAVTAAAN